MIVVIRIKGLVKIDKDKQETLFRLRLRRKYSCVLINEDDKVRLGMLKDVQDFVSYGEIDKDTLELLKKERDRGKEFFRLHPPRGGIKAKLPYPKGVLGHNKKINELIRRML